MADAAHSDTPSFSDQLGAALDFVGKYAMPGLVAGVLSASVFKSFSIDIIEVTQANIAAGAGPEALIGLAVAGAIPALLGSGAFFGISAGYTLTTKAVDKGLDLAIKTSASAITGMKSVFRSLASKPDQAQLRKLLDTADTIQLKEGPNADCWIVMGPNAGEDGITLKNRKQIEAFREMAKEAGFPLTEITGSGTRLTARTTAHNKLDSTATGQPAIEVIDLAGKTPEAKQIMSEWYIGGRPSSEEIIILRKDSNPGDEAEGPKLG
jgi:hypothetical protein